MITQEEWLRAENDSFRGGRKADGSFHQIHVRRLPNGTCYHDETPFECVRAIEVAREAGVKIRLWYGNTTPECDKPVGYVWLEEHEVLGTVGRSTGNIKVPLLIEKPSSMSGGSIMDHCVLRIQRYSDGATLYQHPAFKFPILSISGRGLSGTYPFVVNRCDLGKDEEQARFKTLKAANNYVAFFSQRP